MRCCLLSFASRDFQNSCPWHFFLQSWVYCDLGLFFLNKWKQCLCRLASLLLLKCITVFLLSACHSSALSHYILHDPIQPPDVLSLPLFSSNCTYRPHLALIPLSQLTCIHFPILLFPSEHCLSFSAWQIVSDLHAAASPWSSVCFLPAFEP